MSLAILPAELVAGTMAAITGAKTADCVCVKQNVSCGAAAVI
jgi:hypothetical protein